jgi:Flp pilus assembly pilin Flp
MAEPVDVRQARRARSRHGGMTLVALFVPAVAFPLGLVLLQGDPRFAWLRDLRAYPWELWAVAVCGTAATVGGVLDWSFHRSGDTVVGRREHRAHLLALAAGGVPLFALMAAASLSPRPLRFLLPVLVVLIATVVMICYDEFVFHRRCGRFEAFTHRLLTCGNGLAFLAWAHWCFAREGGLP